MEVKKQEITRRYEHFRKQISHWENAFIKTEGRKPNRDDLNKVPFARDAYKQYFKIKKYIESREKCDKTSEKTKSSSETPKKIFGIFKKPTLTAVSGTKPAEKQHGLYRNLSDKLFTISAHRGELAAVGKSGELGPMRKYSLFSSKRNQSLPVLPEDKIATQGIICNINNKPHVNNQENSITSEKSIFMDEGENVGNVIKATADGENGIDLLSEKQNIHIQKVNSVSAVWQNPNLNQKQLFCKAVKLREVNQDWLDRCTVDFEKNEITNQTESDISYLTETNEISDRLQSKLSSVTQELELESSNVSLDDCSIDELIFENDTGTDNYKTPTYDDGGQIVCERLDGESGDSGIGYTFVLSASDILKVISEELTTPLPVNEIPQIQDTCFQPVHTKTGCKQVLETIDDDALQNIMQSKTEEQNTQTELSPIKTRKRTSKYAFSPTPEKVQPKRKFFKTSSADRTGRAKYTIQSYKPLEPVKKKFVSRKIIPGPGTDDTGLQTSSTKINAFDTNSMTPESNTSKSVEVSDSTTLSSVTVVKKTKLKPVFKVNNVKLRSKPLKLKSNVKLPASASLQAQQPSSSSQQSEVTSKDTRSSKNQAAVDDMYDDTMISKSTRYKRGKLTKQQLLQKKVNTGRVNENFVRIDVSKKVFVRGRKRISGAQTKRNDWKLKKTTASHLQQSNSKVFTCRKCGEIGHFAKYCTKDMMPKDVPEQTDNSPFPSLEEAARMVWSKQAADSQSNRTSLYQSNTQKDTKSGLTSQSQALTVAETEVDVESDIPLPSPHTVNPFNAANSSLKIVPPYFNTDDEFDTFTLEEEDKILNEALKKFGYDDFRPGQKETVTRVLKGLTTLVILSTGTGKSLCYQLPAYLYAKKNPGVLTLCISPLVSLMEDQVQGVPGFLQAACLHGNMTTKQKENVLEKVKSKKLQILLVSPESVCAGLFGLLRGVDDMPPISFACIDEIHCVSQWSHNFRPSYMQICKLLRERLHIKTILGLTATATSQTTMSICEHLKIDPSTTIRGEIIPRNLNLSGSRDRDRDEALLHLLRGSRFKDCDSIIIYCTRREDCIRIATFIRVNLQDNPNFNGVQRAKSRQQISNNCEAYHAGMTPARRRLVQQQFMTGKIRIVVATVAFGMGIDKSDIRAVIHYNMPKTFESYVQEIGRAGRDGLPAHCHLFMDNVKGKDLSELKRHVFSNSVDRPTIRKLIRLIFKPCQCAKIAKLSAKSDIHENMIPSEGNKCPGHEVSFSVNDTVLALDLQQENLATLLCYLELDPHKKWIEILPLTYETCKIHSYGGPQLLKSVALRSPPLAVAIALQKEKGKFKDGDRYIEFNVIEAAAAVGWNSAVVKRELKSIEWTGVDFNGTGNATKFRKSGILVEFCDLAFRVIAPGDLTDEEADSILDSLHGHSKKQERTQLHQLNRIYRSLMSISSANVGSACDDFDEEKSQRLKQFIYEYFNQSAIEIPFVTKADPLDGAEKEEDVRREVRNLILSQQDTQFTGRAIAKIFQGISSPCFPVEHWGRNRSFWRRYIDVDFHLLCQIAGQEIIRYR